MIEGLHAESEITTLLTTHYLDEAERLCDRVAIMHAGRIVALGTPAELRTSMGAEILELRVDGHAQGVLDVLRARGVADDEAFAVGSTVTVPLRGRATADAIADLRELGIPTTAVSARPPTLDDVYLRLTGDRLGAD